MLCNTVPGVFTYRQTCRITCNDTDTFCIASCTYAHHEGVRGSGGTALLILNLDAAVWR